MSKVSKADLTWGGGIVALALGATVARQFGYIDGDTVTRLVLGASGLMVAWYGNRAPKAWAAGPRARRINRFSGWSMALSGLLYAALWAFAPLSVAMTVGTGALLAGVAATVVYGMRLRGRPVAGASNENGGD